MSVFGSNPARVVISAAGADSKYLERCIVHLAPFVRDGKMHCWASTMLEPGSDSHKCIVQHFACPKVGIVLISANYLASDFPIKTELSLLLAAAKRGDTVIMPVILSPCAFQYTELAVYQTINPVSKPLSKLDWHHREEVWTTLAGHVYSAL